MDLVAWEMAAPPEGGYQGGRPLALAAWLRYRGPLGRRPAVIRSISPNSPTSAID